MTEHVCRSCGSPLAADQRYCLQCGNRVAEARVPFLDILGSQRPAVAAGAPAVSERTTRWSFGRMSTNAAAVAGVACLLLALGVGVLIGNSGNKSATDNATPQIISVGGAAPAATTTPAPTANTTANTAAPAAKKKSSSAASSTPAHKTKASNKALQNLDSTSGTDYQKKASKLPKTLGTGGKAPPKDNKPAAGGGSFQSIG